VEQVLVGTVLPSGCPDELVVGDEPPQALADLEGDAMGHPVDQLELARSVLRRLREAEEADHTVHVDRENGALD
jgi:hypothetical protein